MIRPARSAAVVALFAVTTSGCGIVRRIQGDTYSAGNQSLGAISSDDHTVLNGTESDDHLSVTATVSASRTTSQQLNASESGALKGSSVNFQPGTFAVDTAVTLEEGIDLGSDGVLSDLGVSASSASSALVLSSDPVVDPAKPFTVALSTTGTAGLTQAAEAFYFVVFKIKKASDGKYYVGIIPPAEVTITDGIAKFAASWFGSYQIFKADQAPAAQVAESTKPIATKRGGDVAMGSGTSTGTWTGTGTVPGGTLAPLNFASVNFATGTASMELLPTIEMTFDKALSPASAATGVALSEHGTGVAIPTNLFIGNNATTLVLTPQNRLSYVRAYDVDLKPSLSAADGAGLAQPIHLEFTTRDVQAAQTTDTLHSAAGNFNDGNYVVFKSNPLGMKIAAWKAPSDGFLYGSYFDGSTWSTKALLSNASVSNLRAVISQQNVGCVAWTESAKVVTKCYLPGPSPTWTGAVEHQQQMNGPQGVALAVDSSEVIHLFWFEYGAGDYELWTTSHNIDGSWTTAGLLGHTTNPTFGAVRSVATGSSGEIVVAWLNGSGVPHSMYFNGSAWIGPTAVGATVVNFAPQVVIDSGGNAIVAWSGSATFRNIYVKSTPGWGSEELVSTPARFAQLVRSGDTTLLIWSTATASSEIKAQIREGTSSFGPTINVSQTSSGTIDIDPIVAGNASGDFVVSWYQYDATLPAYRPDGAAYHAGAWTIPVHLTPAGCNYYFGTYVGLDDDGNGVFYCTTSASPMTSFRNRFLRGTGFQTSPEPLVGGVLGQATQADGQAMVLLRNNDDLNLLVKTYQ